MNRSATISSRLLFLALVVLASDLCESVFAGSESQLISIGQEIHQIFERNRDAVVKVRASQLSSNTPSLTQTSVFTGTAFFVNSEGHLLTAASVVNGAQNIWIEWRNMTLPCDLVGTDVRSNLAMIQIVTNDVPEPQTDEIFPTPKLEMIENSNLSIGSPLISIGFPYDLGATPHLGFVSGFEANRANFFFPTTMIRTDLPLSPGEGGSPLFNHNGEVVGIVSMVANPNCCYAVPSAAIYRIISDFKQYGKARYGWMGIGVVQARVKPSVPKPVVSNIQIQQVYEGTPAAKAGIQPGDFILKIENYNLTNVVDMIDATFFAEVGKPIRMTIFRSSTEKDIEFTVVERPEALPTVAKFPNVSNKSKPHHTHPLLPASWPNAGN